MLSSSILPTSWGVFSAGIGRHVVGKVLILTEEFAVDLESGKKGGAGREETVPSF
jgi:hypothetical protein